MREALVEKASVGKGYFLGKHFSVSHLIPRTDQTQKAAWKGWAGLWKKEWKFESSGEDGGEEK